MNRSPDFRPVVVSSSRASAGVWRWFYSPPSATISETERRSGRGWGSCARLSRSRATGTPSPGVWWCSNDELPVTTEEHTFEELVARVLEIAPEIAAENGLAAPGDEIELHIVAERVPSVPVVAVA